MGFLDDGFKALTGGNAQVPPAGGAAPPHGLLDGVLGMIGNPGTGGLGGLVEKFKSAGLGDAVSSWVGTGANHPVTGDQVQSALGADQIATWSQKLGIPVDQVKGHLASMLPGLVDKLTPGGQVPGDHGLVQNALGMLKGKLFGGT